MMRLYSWPQILVESPIIVKVADRQALPFDGLFQRLKGKFESLPIVQNWPFQERICFNVNVSNSSREYQGPDLVQDQEVNPNRSLGV